MRLADTRPPFAGLANLTEQQLQSLPTPCYLLDEAQLRRNGEILLGLVQQVAGGGQRSEGRFGEVCQPGEGRACIEHPHQSTRAGLWLSERGRPYLSSASR